MFNNINENKLTEKIENFKKMNERIFEYEENNKKLNERLFELEENNKKLNERRVLEQNIRLIISAIPDIKPHSAWITCAKTFPSGKIISSSGDR